MRASIPEERVDDLGRVVCRNCKWCTHDGPEATKGRCDAPDASPLMTDPVWLDQAGCGLGELRDEEETSRRKEARDA